MKSLWRRIPVGWRDFLCLLVLVAAVVSVALLLGGCAAGEKAGDAIASGAGAVVGFFIAGPPGAFAGGAIVCLWAPSSTQGAATDAVVQQLDPLARAGHWLWGALWWCLAGYALVLFLVPKCRDNLLAALSSRMPVWDRLKSLVAGLIPSPHSPPAAAARKAKREASKVQP